MMDKNKTLKLFGAVAGLAVVVVMLLVWSSTLPKRYGDFEYEITDDGTVTIVEYHGDDKAVELPAKIKDKPVTVIGATAFGECSSLKSVSVPETVLEIEGEAFWRCKKLKQVTLSHGLLKIGTGAFWGCSSLETVRLPASLETIESAVFDHCPLKEVSFAGSEEAWSAVSGLGKEDLTSVIFSK